jgi:PleD family two-component response regulator
MTMAGLKPLVLIVDDSPATVEILGQVLGKDNRIEQAVDGAEALQRVQSGEKPDLILLDVVMAGMDGYEVCERLRANPHTQDIPVIFLTVREEAQDQERGFAAGGVDYIAKPIEPLVVCARVRTQIRLKQRAELLESLVSVDALTGVPNRKAFDHYLETEWKRPSHPRCGLFQGVQ